MLASIIEVKRKKGESVAAFPLRNLDIFAGQ